MAFKILGHEAGNCGLLPLDPKNRLELGRCKILEVLGQGLVAGLPEGEVGLVFVHAGTKFGEYSIGLITVLKI